jgi:opacity protein-like surface antigen
MLRALFTTALLACAAIAGAQSGQAGQAVQTTMTGKWQGDTDGGAALLLDVTVKGETLTGTLTRNGQGSPLSEGKITKNAFSFKATLNERTEGFSGEYKGDEIRIWLERQGPTKAIVLTRVKAAK